MSETAFVLAIAFREGGTIGDRGALDCRLLRADQPLETSDCARSAVVLRYVDDDGTIRANLRRLGLHRSVARTDHVGRPGGWPRRFHSVDPGWRAEIVRQRGAQSVPSITLSRRNTAAWRAAAVGAPEMRNRLIPPSGKMFRLTCVAVTPGVSTLSKAC